MTSVTLENVTKRFGDTVAVDNVSLHITETSFFSLLGPSGCGKTTTMRLIAGLERPDEGKIWIGDTLVFDSSRNLFVPPGQRGVGLVFQNYALWPHMTVRENIVFGLKVRKVASEEQESRYGDITTRLQIVELSDRYPNELSGGQQQRIALARELIANTPVLLMDEPLSNLDAKLRVDMRWELRRIHEEFGTTIIYVTHDQIEALTLASEMAVMREGLVQQNATPDEVYSSPANLFVASFIGSGSINTMNGVVRDGALSVPGYTLPIPPSIGNLTDKTSVKIAVRPEELSFSKDEGPWSVPVHVTGILPMGHAALAQVHPVADTGAIDESAASLTVQFDRRADPVEPGKRMFLQFRPETVHVFADDTERRL